jgi:hypothetical protein
LCRYPRGRLGQRCSPPPPRLSLSHLLTTVFNDGEFEATIQTLIRPLGGRILAAGRYVAKQSNPLTSFSTSLH